MEKEHVFGPAGNAKEPSLQQRLAFAVKVFADANRMFEEELLKVFNEFHAKYGAPIEIEWTTPEESDVKGLYDWGGGIDKPQIAVVLQGAGGGPTSGGGGHLSGGKVTGGGGGSSIGGQMGGGGSHPGDPNANRPKQSTNWLQRIKRVFARGTKMKYTYIGLYPEDGRFDVSGSKSYRAPRTKLAEEGDKSAKVSSLALELAVHVVQRFTYSPKNQDLAALAKQFLQAYEAPPAPSKDPWDSFRLCHCGLSGDLYLIDFRKDRFEGCGYCEGLDPVTPEKVNQALQFLNDRCNELNNQLRDRVQRAQHPLG